jgi:hypothetical protein
MLIGANMPLITPSYQAMQTKFHIDRPDYGTSAAKHTDVILSLAKNLGSRDILDYGCGKSTLQKGIPFPIQNYDPCMEEFNKRPVAADLVVCTDVLEHIEPDCLKEVLDDIRGLTKKALFLNIACRPAKKILPDGRNAHLIIQNPNWWLTWLLPRFNLHAMQATSGDFTAILFSNELDVPKEADA